MGTLEGRQNLRVRSPISGTPLGCGFWTVWYPGSATAGLFGCHPYRGEDRAKPLKGRICKARRSKTPGYDPGFHPSQGEDRARPWKGHS